MPKVRHLVGVAALTAVALVAGLLLARSGQTTPAPQGAATAAPSPTIPAAPSSPEPIPSPAAGSPIIVVEPVAQPQPQPTPGVLAVGPSQVALAQGTWSAQFTVSNVGGSDMAWFAVGVPSAVSLSSTQGWLSPGAETTVTATVDHTKLAKGPFSLTLHVSANDTADSVTLTGTKQVKVAVPQGPNVITGK